jgi:cyclic beta-1,2-glucan synthetase
MNSSTVEPVTVLSDDNENISAMLTDPRADDPIRAELLGVERLEAHARRLAHACLLAAPRRASSPLLARFVENGRVLKRVHEQLLARADRRAIRSIDAEWLVDNFYIIEDSLREIRRDLPPGYDEQLPKLAAAPLEGYPRVYALALAIVAHTDSELDEPRIVQFVRAFQEVAPLSIGELWALPTMLRLVLVENLRRLAEKMVWEWEEQRRAERWASDARASTPRPPAPAGITRKAPPPLVDLTDPFVVRLLQLVRDQEQTTTTFEQLEPELAAQGFEPSGVLQREHRREAANQVTVGNCVLSLRLLSAVDWNSFFEQSSRVEAILREDPAGVYCHQDFQTSDRYRRVIEAIARGAYADEVDVARYAIDLARRGRSSAASPNDHVGYYLIDRGQTDLKAAFGYQPGWRERLREWVVSHGVMVYFGSITVLLCFILTVMIAASLGPLVASWWIPFVVALLLLPLSELAVGLVHQFLTLLLPPRVLPKLDFKEGIPAQHATFIVIPGMLARQSSARALLERLEIHYLANPDPNLRFALLTDFADAAQEKLPQDDELLRDALEQVKALNERYSSGQEIFLLFHRRRLWNPSEQCWMGWERKRGKLLEFNRLVRGDTGTSYAVLSSDPMDLPRPQFVITLDADTQITRDTASRLVGSIAHPLNRAQFDPAQERVVAGFGVLQPRVSFHLTAATHSRFAALLAISGGIDPYSTAASDAYMDLFGIGSFTGKGIYDIDAFQAATGTTFPENHVLSHDLIEGNYARCGLLSDTELFDDFPARYHAYACREHRWARGDWQLLPWLGPHVPSPTGLRANPLSLVERWKLFDNLRRSLVSPALLLLLLLGWLVLPGSPWIWTSTVLVTLALPLIQFVLVAIVDSVRAGSLVGFKSGQGGALPRLIQVLLESTFLAHRAALMVDAIALTLVRLFVTRRKLLEWETAASAEQRLKGGLLQFVSSMWPAPALALSAGALVLPLRPGSLPAAAPFLLAWFLSPAVAYLISQPRPVKEPPISDADRRTLRRIARKTWHFFATFVGEEDNWLAPDNFQEIPRGRIAHRTSPTNAGMLLISTLAAHDLGYITLGNLIERLEHTFDTFDRMEKRWGHFYNWYDTRSLETLSPQYISTVDSGNLLACLVALKQGLLEKPDEPILGPHVIDGLADSLALVGDRGGDEWHAVSSIFDERPGNLLDWASWLANLEKQSVGALSRMRARAASGSDRGDSEDWAKRLVEEIRAWRAELAAITPWVSELRACERFESGSPGLAQVSQRWAAIRAELLDPTSLTVVARRSDRLLSELGELVRGAPEVPEITALLETFRQSGSAELLDRLMRLIDRAETLSAGMDFTPLYRPERHLFAIGFNVAQGRLDSACYDLLASEACLASYLAVARGEAPRRHWFQLGRHFIRAASRLGVISWGGTMFEYVMPRLLLRSLPGTLLAEAAKTAVARQIEYGDSWGLPWGVSESSFSAQSPDGDYHYQAFGVPGLGLKQGLEEDQVVAPYATALAAMIAPRQAIDNFHRLAREGALGSFGFYEAIDYTPRRMRRGQRSVVVRTFMAHHQGMSLTALANVLLDDVMPRRFHAEPKVRAIELLLQERVPPDPEIIETPAAKSAAEEPIAAEFKSDVTPMSRRLSTPVTPAPRTHLLSNSRYHVMITNAGSGYSACGGIDVTRWREDSTCEAWGQFCYIRDMHRGLVWSAGFQPICRPAETNEVSFAADKATFRRRDAEIETLLEVIVSPEQTVEVRRVTLTNHDLEPRELELTSYAEIVLAPHAADLAHPAFSKLFLETEWLSGPKALLCRRRGRSAGEQSIWAVHVSAVDVRAPLATTVGEIQFETDRMRFIGRGRTPASPAALEPDAILSGTTGPVLDPIFALRQRVRLEPGGSAVLALTTGVAFLRSEALALADQYREVAAASRDFELAWAHNRVELRHGEQIGENTHLFQRLASHVLFAGSALRADPSLLAGNRLGQKALLRLGISGTRPIILARIAARAELPLARELLAAHSYLRLRELETDLIFLLEEPPGDAGEQSRRLTELIRSAGSQERMDEPGGVFVRKATELSEEETVLLQAAARVILRGDRGSLGDQLERTDRRSALPLPVTVSRERTTWDDVPVELPSDLRFQNGLGGFTPDGREYCLLVSGQYASDASPLASRTAGYPRLAPAPWVNVVANPGFGFLVSESGSGFTWSGNSQANRLTPWNNDPVSDSPGEVVYLRDDDTGEIWCPTPLPVLSGQPTLVRHGQGYTIFERNCRGLCHRLTLLVPPDDPIKLLCLEVKNVCDRSRRLSATYFAEWILGQIRDTSAMHVVTEIDPLTGALFARNAFRAEFAESVAFVDVDRRPRAAGADRTTFLGRHGSLAAPTGLGCRDLPSEVGAALDPCAAIQVAFDLEPGKNTRIVFLLGEAEGPESARALIRRYREEGSALMALQQVRKRWDDLLETVQIRTPDPALDLLVNRWLLYQVQSCRIWGRSAFYQSGGAYGFRDQLQDVMALFDAAPQEARAHILRAAGRQFLEGDVQHWWHPPTGRGIRTRIADDPLWLPFVTSHYVNRTGDVSILDERVSYLEAARLKPGQEDSYGVPATSECAPLYDHCVRALEVAFRTGSHGLPLMGHGDWNDGMNRVGWHDKGESVWLAWFSISCLTQFAEIAETRGDVARSDRFRCQAVALRNAVEAHAWDGDWYRRAFFDDGTALGSSGDAACAIDSIAQSWAVLSGAGDPARATRAMEAVDQKLVQRDPGLILLFTPPFDDDSRDPGYLKGYLPGVRENGGQYTHAAAWVIQATARLGHGHRAFEYLQLVNPIRHARDLHGVERYKVEPYVLAGDVYSGHPHAGRGGWTWYTGSASWIYRVILESILGMERRGNRMLVNACIPPDWALYEVIFRFRTAVYRIKVENPTRAQSGVSALWLDNTLMREPSFLIQDDGQTHQVRIVIGPDADRNVNGLSEALSSGGG